MNLNEYQEAALRTCSEKLRGSLFYSQCSLSGEAGEFADAFKKHQFHDKPADEAEARLAMIIELGDALWSVAHAADALGVGLEVVANVNLEKLARRHGKSYKAEHYTGGAK